MKLKLFLLLITKLSATNLNQRGTGLYRRQENSAYPIPESYNKYANEPEAEENCSKFIVNTDPCFIQKDRSKVKPLPKGSDAYGEPFKKPSPKYGEESNYSPKYEESNYSPKDDYEETENPPKRRKPKKRKKKSSRRRRRPRYYESEPYYPDYSNGYYPPQPPAYPSGYSMPPSNPTPVYNNGYSMPPPTVDPNTGYPAPAAGYTPPAPPMNPQPYYLPVGAQTYGNPGTYTDPSINYSPYPVNPSYQPPPYAPIY